jgi:NAD(P)-dependent dehydrogenase (short-subunit alcohol dehydrogenase family)
MSDQPTVVLTGASAGIGLAALEALKEEAFVIAVSRTRPPSSPLNGHWLQGDLCAPEAVAADIRALLLADKKPLDGLIHCAVSYGATQRHAFLETSDREWDELMAVNTRSQFILTIRLLPLLLERPKAFIVSLTSDAAAQPAPQRIAYGCSKAASHALFSGLSAELADSSIAVIQILPAKQVVTRGMRRRRPPDFSFAGYSSPEIFKQPFKSILARRGAGLNGVCLVVREEPQERAAIV